jgi:hypothetical protein
VFVPGKLLQPSLVFVSKAIVYLTDASSKVGCWPCTQTLEKPAGDKHSSLLQKFVNYGEKSFITFPPDRNHLGSVQPCRLQPQEGTCSGVDLTKLFTVVSYDFS